MDENVSQLLAAAAAVAAVSVGYGKVFGKYQFRLVEWILTATCAPGRYKGLVNLAVGVAVATGFSAFAAWRADHDWALLALGCLAGVFASVEAADVHDHQAAEEPPATDGEPASSGGAPIDELRPAA
jgi:hypothetical protein